MNFDEVKTITLKLLDYCRANEWKGYDPYDALNSPIFKWVPFLDSRWPRIIATQVLKRSPINFRPLLGIPKTENPKALALFLISFIKLKKLGLLKDEGLIDLMFQKIVALRSPYYLVNPQPNNPSNPSNPSNPINPSNPGVVTDHCPLVTDHSYFCWGYSFPWQTRTILVPRGAPNLVCTSFVANALLDLYENNRDPKSLEMAVNSASYIANELYWEDGNGAASFSYPIPSYKSKVHNANFLGAALLCRVYKHTGDRRFLDPALKAVRYSVSRQHEDGSWSYGELQTQGWVDNFHTGYNLCALRAISDYIGSNEFETSKKKGFDFYRKHFFLEDGTTKYFHDRLYPIDIHSVAQSIITLMEFRDIGGDNLNLAESILGWSMNHMQNGDGHCYYQKLPAYTVKIPYMRWSQAWMVLALSSMLEVQQLSYH